MAAGGEVFGVGGELFADQTVELCGDRQAGGAAEAILAAVVAAGDVAEQLPGDRDAGVLQGADQGPGTEQVAGERERFLRADVFRAAAVVAEDDVAQLAGQGTVRHVGGQLTVVTDQVMRAATVQVDDGGL